MSSDTGPNGSPRRDDDAPESRKLPNTRMCFVCGHSNSMGLGARFWTDGESVWTSFTPAEQHVGYRGITHGGILAALLDEAMGWATSLKNRRFCVSIEISVQYLKPAPLGRRLTISAHSVSARRRVWEAEGEVRDEAGDLYACARGRYVPMSHEQTLAVMDYLHFDEGTVPPERLVGR